MYLFVFVDIESRRRNTKDHKTALVTGATEGIGLELTRSFAEAGYDTLPKKFDYNTMIKKIINCYETLL